MLTPTGRAPGAGAIAERYEALGGNVVWIGKPHLPIYQYAQRKLGIAFPARVLCVGDSVEHDIVGARGFGAAAALMLTGILAELSEAELQREFARHGASADLIIADFTQPSTNTPEGGGGSRAGPRFVERAGEFTLSPRCRARRRIPS